VVVLGLTRGLVLERQLPELALEEARWEKWRKQPIQRLRTEEPKGEDGLGAG
jgi:hypothetical protein